jgi:hypothetical protein
VWLRIGTIEALVNTVMNLQVARFDVFTAAKIQVEVLWVVTFLPPSST